jgi:hypothetical protein
MYPPGTPPGDDPFGLFGTPGDPFATEPQGGTPPPAPAAGVPPAGAPPTIDPATGQPVVTAPGFVAVDDFNRVKSELEATRAQVQPLAWIGEAMQRDPTLQGRIQQALFNTGGGAGAPPSVTPPAGPDPVAVAAERDRLMAPARAKLAAGDLEGAMGEMMTASATLAQASMRSQFEAAAGPALSLTAQNAIESFKNSKRAGPSGALFAKLEGRFAAFVAQTPPQVLAQLAQSGQLYAALEAGWKTVLADSYEQAYGKAVADGRITPQAPAAPPPYGSLASGGPGPTAPVLTDEAKDDAEFEKMAAARGIVLRNSTENGMTFEHR